MSVLFRTSDIDELAAASDDRSPLHMSSAYARRTAFGERVPHGVLGLVAAVGSISPREGALSELTIDFGAPLFTDLSYEVRADDSGSRVRARIVDGHRPLLRLDARFTRAGVPTTGSGWTRCRPREVARAWEERDFVGGLRVSGAYGPPRERITALAERYGLGARGVSEDHLLAILGSSYVVGMELPGESALFSRLKLVFTGAPRGAGELRFEATVRSFDERYGLLELEVDFAGGDAPFARATIQAFARRTPPELDVERLERTDDAAGKVAVVIGASRGLGAALARALTLRGAAVFGTYTQSTEKAESLAAAIRRDGRGSFVPLRADAGSDDDCRALREAVLKSHGKVDWLVCSATPALHPLWLDAASTARTVDFVSRSLAMVAYPVGHLVDLVADASGTLLVVSSIAVEDVPPEWPHYVAAKAAVEALARAAALEYPSVGVMVARPGLLLSDLNNTPLATEAQRVEDAANAIVRRLVAPRVKGDGPLVFSTSPR